ncbi:MAG: nicotinate-nucleotide adenylyltransferase [Ktedonobacteraceae bacterium]|nr:nicotinate-nucleotide adenylyltransferase [Ktedonobacteraceae bacterium]
MGLLGGTFDPIHYGHLLVAEEVRAALQLSQVVFIPTGHPPHKAQQRVTAAQQRVSMLELAIASNPYFSISLVDVQRAGPSYTVDTLRLLREQWGQEIAIDFIIGGDSLEDLCSWYEPAAILAQLTHLVAVGRPGYRATPDYLEQLEERLPGIKPRLVFVNTPRLEISATDLRLRVAEGRPIKYQTPEAVEHYIAQQNLYREKRAGDIQRREAHDAHAI